MYYIKHYLFVFYIFKGFTFFWTVQFKIFLYTNKVIVLGVIIVVGMLDVSCQYTIHSINILL